MKIELVIARFNENTSWTEQLKFSPQSEYIHSVIYYVTLYNKGEPLARRVETNYREIPLPNIGREAHTYLYHLTNEYDNLSEITVFCQGNPFPHAPNLFPEIEMICGGTERMYSLCPDPLGYIPLGYMHLVSDRNGGSPIPGQPFHIGGLEVGKLVELIFRDYRPDIADLECFPFSAGACFLVGRETVLAKPRQWYEHVLKCCESVGEGYPWVMERLWGYIFK